MQLGLLIEDVELGLLIGNCCLLGTQDFVGSSAWKLGNRNVGARVIFDLYGGSVEAREKVGSARRGKGELEVLIMTFRNFKGTAACPENAVP